MTHASALRTGWARSVPASRPCAKAATNAMYESRWIPSHPRWVSDERFLDLLGMTNLIPGPNSTELAIHLGQVRAGFAGLVVAGVCFITPAMLIILPLAWAYVTYGAVPALGSALVGIKACMVAIVAVALWRFGRTGIRDGFTATLAMS